jgi:hypothetical protein
MFSSPSFFQRFFVWPHRESTEVGYESHDLTVRCLHDGLCKTSIVFPLVLVTTESYLFGMPLVPRYGYHVTAGSEESPYPSA